jgi:hypothetical protein
MDGSTYCCTSRASEGRGSSLTLGLSGPMRQPKFSGSSKGPEQRESAVSEVRAPMLPAAVCGSTRGPDKVSAAVGLAHLLTHDHD